MNQYCVVVANGSQAKFFTLENSEFPELESSPTLVEATTITHPDYISIQKYRPFHGQEGLSAGPTTVVSENHIQDRNKKFLKTIAKEADKMNKDFNFSEMVLVSQKRLINDLRLAVTDKVKGVHTQELAKDLSKLGPRELHNYLAKEKLLPIRRNPGH